MWCNGFDIIGCIYFVVNIVCFWYNDLILLGCVNVFI